MKRGKYVDLTKIINYEERTAVIDYMLSAAKVVGAHVYGSFEDWYLKASIGFNPINIVTNNLQNHYITHSWTPKDGEEVTYQEWVTWIMSKEWEK